MQQIASACYQRIMAGKKIWGFQEEGESDLLLGVLREQLRLQVAE